MIFLQTDKLYCLRCFLAHLSRRLIGELIVYPWSGVRRTSSSSTMLKHFLLRNRLADRSQILCGASLGRGNEIFSRHLDHMNKIAATPIYGKKPFKNLLLQNRQADFHETWYVASGTPAHHSLFNDDPGVTLTYFTARSNLVT